MDLPFKITPSRKMDMIAEEIRRLTFDLDNGIFEDARTEEIIHMNINKKKEQYISEVHKNRIYPQTRKRRGGQEQVLWVTKLPDGSQKTAATKEGLIDKLFEIYFNGVDPFEKKKPPTLEDLYKNFMLWKQMEGVSGKTLKEYAGIWKSYYAPYKIVKVPVAQLTHKDWMNFFKMLCAEKSLTKKRYTDIKSVISSFMRYCIDEEIIPYSPVDHIDYKRLPLAPDAPSNSIKTVEFKPEEVKALVKWAFDEMERPNTRPIYSFAILLNLQLGLRASELEDLKWEHVNWNERSIFICGQRLAKVEMDEDITFSKKPKEHVDHLKSHEDARTLPLTDTAISVLREIKALGYSDEMIFPKGYFNYRTYNDKIKRAAQCIGLNPALYHTHSIRTTVASSMYNKSLDIKLVQKMMGHTTPGMTSKYVKDWKTVNEMRDAIDAGLSDFGLTGLTTGKIKKKHKEYCR